MIHWHIYLVVMKLDSFKHRNPAGLWWVSIPAHPDTGNNWLILVQNSVNVFTSTIHPRFARWIFASLKDPIFINWLMSEANIGAKRLLISTRNRRRTSPTQAKSISLLQNYSYRRPVFIWNLGGRLACLLYVCFGTSGDLLSDTNHF